jgi:hypothetical protein
VDYRAPVRGQSIDLPAVAAAVPLGDGKAPTYLHFYNPHCSCAPGAVEELAAMMASNPAGARFAAVVDPRWGGAALAQRQLASLHIPVIADPGGGIARACGVDAAPEAVIFDPRGRISFRGGYGVAMVGPYLVASNSGALADPYLCRSHDPGLITAGAPDDEP